MNNQEVKLAKVRRSCSAAKIVTMIAAILSSICSGVSGLAAFIMFVASTPVNEFIAANPDMVSGQIESNGLIHYSVDLDALAQEGAVAQGIGVCFITVCVACALIAVAFFVLSNVFTRMKASDSPFQSSFMKPLKIIFIIAIIAMLLFVGVLPAIFLALLLWCVYTIIDYGCVLQEDVDNTI